MCRGTRCSAKLTTLKAPLRLRRRRPPLANFTRDPEEFRAAELPLLTPEAAAPSLAGQ
jgi:hypothetical protein